MLYKHYTTAIYQIPQILIQQEDYVIKTLLKSCFKGISQKLFLMHSPSLRCTNLKRVKTVQEIEKGRNVDHQHSCLFMNLLTGQSYNVSTLFNQHQLVFWKNQNNFLPHMIRSRHFLIHYQIPYRCFHIILIVSSQIRTELDSSW